MQEYFHIKFISERAHLKCTVVMVACVFTGCDFIANDRVGFFNHVPDHDGDEEVKVLEFSSVVFVINI